MGGCRRKGFNSKTLDKIRNTKVGILSSLYIVLIILLKGVMDPETLF